MNTPRVLIIDNYNSFTYNLYQYLGEAGAEVIVQRNDALDLAGVIAIAPTHIVLSPGPGHPANPRDFGICREIILELGARLPLLGVCLGHQGLVHHLGGTVGRAPTIVHGKTSRVRHDGTGLFAGLPAELHVMRYHSLVAERASLPACLRVTAESDDGLVMAVAHDTWPAVGVQFHPESIGTPTGRQLLAHFLAMTPTANPTANPTS